MSKNNMQLHELKTKFKRKTKKRVGRGGNLGKTAGRGMNGQRAHGAGAPRPDMRDRIKKLPKKRGHRIAGVRFSTTKTAYETVNLDTLNKAFSDGQEINPKALLEKGLISRTGGKIPNVKILGSGELTVKNLTFTGCQFSATAKEKITKAGGKISV